MRIHWPFIPLITLATFFTSCAPDSAVRTVAIKNNCDQVLHVDAETSEARVGENRLVANPGGTARFAGFANSSTVYARWELSSKNSGPLDDSLPVYSYNPDELFPATPEEEEKYGYEFYFIIKGDLCP